MSPRTIASLSRVDCQSEAPQTAEALIAAFLSSFQDAASRTVADHRAAAHHFLYWIHQQGIAASAIDDTVVRHFEGHRCRCRPFSHHEPSRSYFYLYVILDIFSRRVVGWCVADAESAALFKPLFDDAITKHDVPPGQLTLHADRGGPMKAKGHSAAARRSRRHPLAQSAAHIQRQPILRKPLQDLEVPAAVPPTLRLHRGRQKLLPTLLRLVQPRSPPRGIGLMTPDQVHYGQTDAVHSARQLTLDRAFRENPARFVNRPPTPPAKPTAAWINPPTPKSRA